MHLSSERYGLASGNGEPITGERFDSIADVLDYAQQTGLSVGAEATITGTSWPGLVIRVSRI